MATLNVLQTFGLHYPNPPLLSANPRSGLTVTEGDNPIPRFTQGNVLATVAYLGSTPGDKELKPFAWVFTREPSENGFADTVVGECISLADGALRAPERERKNIRFPGIPCKTGEEARTVNIVNIDPETHQIDVDVRAYRPTSEAVQREIGSREVLDVENYTDVGGEIDLQWVVITAKDRDSLVTKRVLTARTSVVDESVFLGAFYTTSDSVLVKGFAKPDTSGLSVSSALSRQSTYCRPEPT